MPLYRQENGGSGRGVSCAGLGEPKQGSVLAACHRGTPPPLRGSSEGWFTQDHMNPSSMRKSGVRGKAEATEPQSTRTLGPSPAPAVKVPRHRGAWSLTGPWGWGRTTPRFVNHLPDTLLTWAWVAPNKKELMLIPSLRAVDERTCLAWPWLQVRTP